MDDISQWLAQKLDEPWSSYRLSASLTGDIFDRVGRAVLDLDPIVLGRLLLAILHLRPAQIRELQVDIDAFLSKCESALSRSDADHDWALFLVRSLKGFAKQRRVDADPQRPDLKPFLEELIESAAPTEIRPWMIPPETKYLDPTLLPAMVPESHQHFQVRHPFTFEHEEAEKTTTSPVKAPPPPVAPRPVPRAAPLPRVPPPPPPVRAGFAKKATINRMGLEDVAQLQERMKRSGGAGRNGPAGSDELRRKEKMDMKMKEKAEKEQKRIEERDLKKRKKEDEKEAKRIERELIKEQKNRALMEQLQQRESEAMDSAAREAAEAFVRQSAAAMPVPPLPTNNSALMNPAHLLAQIQNGIFSNPSPYQPMMMMMPPSHTEPPAVASAVDLDKGPYASMFMGANALTPANRALIERFLAGEVVDHPDAQNGVLQVVMSENYTQDHNLDGFLEIVVFEMNFFAGSWRKLKRRKRLTQQHQQLPVKI